MSKALKVRVIITAIDNNNWDHGLANCLNIPVITVANGWRHPEHISDKEFDCYYSMSTAPIDPHLAFNISCKEFHPVGHFKMGLFYEEALKHRRFEQNSKGNTVLWISQYRQYIYDSDLPVHREQKKAEALGIEFLSRYSADKNIQSRVALATERNLQFKNNEIECFNSIAANKIEFAHNYKDPWGAYWEVSKASLIIGMYSTLLFESLSVGKRVVFFLPKRLSALYEYVGQGTRLDRISPLLFTGENYQEFAEHCDFVMNIPDIEYTALVEDLRKDVACFNPDELPQHKIKEKVAEILSA